MKLIKTYALINKRDDANNYDKNKKNVEIDKIKKSF